MIRNSRCGAGAWLDLGWGQTRPGEQDGGFSLLELVTAMAIFLIVGGTAISLFSRHEALLTQEQGVTGLNIGLRNALSQIQMDVVNAGSGVITGNQQIPSWPVGVTIINSNPNATPACSPSTTGATPGVYSTNCFDQLNVVMVDANTPALQLLSSYGIPSGGTCLNTNSTNCNDAPASPSSTTKYNVIGSLPTGYSSSTYASHFLAGDYVLFVDVAQLSGWQYITTAALASGGVNSSPNVQLTFYATQPGGFNYGNTNGNDLLGITTPFCNVTTTALSAAVNWYSGNYFPPDPSSPWDGQQIQIGNIPYTVSAVPSTKQLTLSGNVAAGAGQSNAPLFTSYSLTNTFYGGDWVLRLLPIQYSVDVTNPSDPKLVRTQGGVPNVVMDQVIGFKVGAVWWNNSLTLDDFQYDYNSADYGNNFTLVRAIRVSIIGRTPPSTDPTYTYTNPFDGGRYQIRGSSIVVNPRNLTMSND